MTTEAVVQKISDMFGSAYVPRIRELLNVPEPSKEVLEMSFETWLKTASIEDIWQFYSSSYSGAGDENRVKASQRLVEILQPKLEKAETLKKIRSICFRAPHGSRLRQEAAEKIAEILRPELDEAVTFKECMAIIGKIPSESNLKLEALKKAFSLAKTVEEYYVVWSNTPGNSEFIQQVAEKIEFLLLPKLESATTVDECLYVHRNTGHAGFKLHQEAVDKALSLAQTVEDWKSAFEMTRLYSAQQDTCIRALAKLLESTAV